MRVVAGPAEIEAALGRLVTEIDAAMADVPRWAIVGIRAGGVPLADRLSARLRGPHRRGSVDITLYRDDLYTGLEKPVLGDTDLPFPIDRTGIVLVDDVCFTGRTIRAAMGEVWDFGRPAFIRLAVLVDRGHRELPIAPDFCGLRVETTKQEKVVVDWELDRVTVV